MTNNRNSVRSFGPGYDWEEGAYPTPSESVRDYIEDERKDGVPNQAPPEKLFGGDPGVDRDTSGGDSESDEAGIETFQGVLLSVIPPHILVRQIVSISSWASYISATIKSGSGFPFGEMLLSVSLSSLMFPPIQPLR